MSVAGAVGHQVLPQTRGVIRARALTTCTGAVCNSEVQHYVNKAKVFESFALCMPCFAQVPVASEYNEPQAEEAQHCQGREEGDDQAGE